jgi:hypothetical protein
MDFGNWLVIVQSIHTKKSFQFFGHFLLLFQKNTIENILLNISGISSSLFPKIVETSKKS